MKDPKVIIATDVSRVAVDYAKKMDISTDEAMRIFISSTTYRALINIDTGLCFEMYNAIYDMFIEEMDKK